MALAGIFFFSSEVSFLNLASKMRSCFFLVSMTTHLRLRLLCGLYPLPLDRSSMRNGLTLGTLMGDLSLRFFIFL